MFRIQKEMFKKDNKRKYLRNINNNSLLNDNVNLPRFDSTDQDIEKKTRLT